MTYTVIIHYVNGSKSEHPFDTYLNARDFFQRNISYSGDRVRRVEVAEAGSYRAIWDISWDAWSKITGLRDGVAMGAPRF